MKALSHIFKLTCFTALLGWLVLFLMPLWPVIGFSPQSFVVGIVALLLSIAYVYLVFLGKRHDDPDHKIRGSFWSLKGIINLFKTPRIVLAGWVHYLVFDLMVGLFIVTNAAHYNISHWLLLPCLFLTMMFGPAGLLLYLLLRFVLTGDYFAAYFF
jgi:hypothetical protein